MKAYKILLAIIYIFDLFYIFYAKDHHLNIHLNTLFNVSIGLWGLFTVFFLFVNLAKEKVMNVIVNAFNDYFDKNKKNKEKFIKQSKIMFSLNLILLAGLILSLGFKDLYIACGILTAFTLLYSTFMNNFLKKI